MKSRFRKMARLALALCVASFAGTAALAQDPRASFAQKSARDFLSLTDRNDVQASWQSAGKQFQNALTPERLAKALDSARLPLRAPADRTLMSTQFTSSFPGAAGEGEYALLVFRTNFAKRSGVAETVTLEREPDGKWRVIGYLVQ